jgi:hypothetical protein
MRRPSCQALLAFLGFSMFPADVSSDEKIEKPTTSLTAQEEQLIRHSVRGGGGTYVPRTGEWAGYVILDVPGSITDVYKMKKRATLRLLASIIECGERDDVLTAAGYAFALGDSPIAGAIMSTYPPELVDTLGGAPGTTYRADLLKKVKKLITDTRD